MSSASCSAKTDVPAVVDGAPYCDAAEEAGGGGGGDAVGDSPGSRLRLIPANVAGKWTTTSVLPCPLLAPCPCENPSLWYRNFLFELTN